MAESIERAHSSTGPQVLRGPSNSLPLLYSISNMCTLYTLYVTGTIFILMWVQYLCDCDCDCVFESMLVNIGVFVPLPLLLSRRCNGDTIDFEIQSISDIVAIAKLWHESRQEPLSISRQIGIQNRTQKGGFRCTLFVCINFFLTWFREFWALNPSWWFFFAWKIIHFLTNFETTGGGPKFEDFLIDFSFDALRIF